MELIMTSDGWMEKTDDGSGLPYRAEGSKPRKERPSEGQQRLGREFQYILDMPLTPSLEKDKTPNEKAGISPVTVRRLMAEHERHLPKGAKLYSTPNMYHLEKEIARNFR